MPLPLMLTAGALLLGLVALLIRRRRRAAAAAGAVATPGADRGAADSWRPLGTADRIKAVMRGGRTGIRLLRRDRDTIQVHREDHAIRIVARYDSVYGGRPNWEHITAVTRVMGRAERCWPGANLVGTLQYADTAVPVEYSPRLVADLEDATAPDPDGATPA